MTLASWFHTLNPVLVPISGSFSIRYYGVAYLLGFLLGAIALRALAKRGLILLPYDRVMDAITYLVLGVMLGGRLGYIVFYQPSLLTQFSADFPWWGPLMINNGGMASHGGMIGVGIAAWFVARGFRTESGATLGRSPMLHVADYAILAAPAGLMLGRLANFVNGELLGEVVSPAGTPGPWWAVKFPQEIIERPESLKALSPEARNELLDLAFLANPSANSFDTAYRELLNKVQHGVPQGVQQGSVDWAAKLEPYISSRHPSQLYQAAAEGLVLGAVLWWFWRVPRRPGAVSALFLVTYGVLRVVTEFWRLPDAGIDRVLGLSRGQWLSVGMVAGGLFLAWLVRRAKQPKLGGWARTTVSGV